VLILSTQGKSKILHWMVGGTSGLGLAVELLVSMETFSHSRCKVRSSKRINL